MRKVLITLVILIGGLSFGVIVYSAETVDDVIITVNSGMEQYSKKFNVDVAIQFNNRDLYNDEVYLAYHLYDRDHQMILWEGQRFPIAMDNEGKSQISFNADLMSGIQSFSTKQAIMKFDLVDEKNAYWFSTNPEINMYSDEIGYSANYFKKSISVIKNSVINSPIIFMVNALCFVLFIVLFIKIRKSQLFVN